jgi:murein DD-endopeptidase MepM/ murein hydrolase activator NlpD
LPEPPQPVEKPKVVFPLLNTHKAWYSADALFSEYQGHPEHARDINRESFGDTDRGEPVIAPFDGFIVDCGDYGLNYGWIVSVLSLDSLDKTPDLNMCRLRHLQNVVVKKGDAVRAGDPIGEIGKPAPDQAAHLHLEMWIIRIPTPRQDWRSTEWKVPDPADWFRWHGVSAELLDRLTKFDGR